MREDVLPLEFGQISNLISYVHRKNNNEYSSSCPVCGGEVHKSSGDFPDRFVMFRVSKYGFSLGFCRRCGYRWTPKGKELSKEQIEQWRKEQIVVEKARKEAAERALELLQNDKIWQQFYSQNNDWSKQVFHEWGISDNWIDYLQLGLMPDYLVKHDDEQYHSPAATIPIWKVGGIVQNIKLRILNPHCGGDRYRNFYAMGESFLFVPMYDLPLSGAGVVVEGEKKAIVLEQTLDNPNIRVVGIQSRSPEPTIFDQMKNLNPIYVWLDPDCFTVEYDKYGKPRETSVERVVRLIGKDKDIRVVDCPMKCDDGIVKYGLEPQSYLRMAKRV